MKLCKLTQMYMCTYVCIAKNNLNVYVYLCTHVAKNNTNVNVYICIYV